MDKQLFNNQSLFSEYYLQELVQDDDFWVESLGRAQEAWEKIKGIYAKVGKRLPGANEAETEYLFIRPVLDALGHTFTLGPTVPSPEGHRRPDFAFFATEDDLREAERSFKGKVGFFKTSLAVGDAKQWDRSLDKKLKGPGDPFTNHNPSYQIDFYLRATNCRWGILTNGRLWRLYNRDSSYRFDIYYEIDLPSLLEGDRFEAEAFAYFFAFFRKDAFVKPIDRECFLDRAFKSSLEYTSRLGEELKENVYEALRLLAEGFLKFPGNALSTDGDLDRIRENAFVLIYRILFTLYAEDRGLLPIHNSVYQSYSLRRLAREVAEKLDQRVPLSPTVSGYWARVTDLFRIVNEGDSYLGVPPYNGGLFDDTKHPFLAKCRIGDRYLAQAIERLTRAEASGRIGRGFLSYRDMEIRHLGSIYEGLLEHRLRVPQVDIAVIKEDKKEKFVPASEAGKRRVLKTYKAGEVYLETDKGERKATGSYYTPDFIVKYIVENTLGPLIQEKKQKIRKKLENLREKVKIHRGANREAYERELKRAESELIDEILSIKVLDPAMGSGHFLVEATDYLARALVEALLGEAALETPMAEARLTREEPLPYGVKTVASEPASDEKARLEEDIRWARREVVEKCIYGVDLNPLAVELAKLSLWLYTVAVNKPLNFLDHHLRSGNSLIGARIKDLTGLPVLRKKKVGAAISDHSKPLQLGLFEQVFKEKVNLLLKDFELIEMLPSETVEDIKKKDGYYQNFRKRVERFKEVADIWTSVYFGNEVAWQDYQTMQEKLRATDQEWQELKQKPWFVKGLQIMEQKRFFHWELEFPEVFYEGAQEKENPGFDVVVGNPPWGAEFDLIEKIYFRSKYVAIIIRMIDSSMYFLAEELNLSKHQGFIGLVLPSPLLTQVDVSKLRKKLLDETSITRLVNLGDFVFGADLANPSCILVTHKSAYKNGQPVAVLDLRHIPPSKKGQIVASQELPSRAILQSFYMATHNYSLITKGFEVAALVNKLRRTSALLKDVISGEIERGISADYASASIVTGVDISERNFEKTICRKVITGHNVARYLSHFSDEYIIYLTRNDDLKDYPNIEKHLAAFRKKITCPEVRENKHPWYALHRPRNPDLFKSPKLVGLTTTDKLIVAPEFSDLYTMDNLYIIHLKCHDKRAHLGLLSLLNSSLLSFIYRYFAQEEERVFPQVKAENLYLLPIRNIDFITPEKDHARLLKKGQTLYERCLGENDVLCVTGFVDHCLQQKPEQADVVHDLLAFLAEQMIQLNKQKQDEIKGFLGWLEREIGAKVNDLKQKTKIKEYHKGTFEDLLEALKENRKALAVDPSRKAFQDCLKAEFEGSLAKLQPVKERLALTDHLIDQIVYKLYGLTEEEVRVVEGKSGSMG